MKDLRRNHLLPFSLNLFIFFLFLFTLAFNGQRLESFQSLVILEVTPVGINVIKGGLVKTKLHTCMYSVTDVFY